MNIDFALIIAIAVVTFLLVGSKTYVAFVTLALASGYVLSEFVAEPLLGIINDTAEEDVTLSVVRVALILLPMLLVAYRFKKTQRGSLRFFQQLVPAFSLALMLAVFVFSALSFDTTRYLHEMSFFFTQVLAAKPALVTFAIAAAIFDVVVQHAGEPEKKKRGRPSKHD